MGLHVIRDSLAGHHLCTGHRLEYQALSGEVPKRSQRRRLEIGWSGNSGTWVRIPPSPPLVLTFFIRHLSLRRSAPSGQSSAQSGHCRRIRCQLDLGVGHSFNSSSVSVHRRLDQRDVAFQCTLHPRRIGAPHGRGAVSVLSGDKERIFADHEIPADGGVPGAIGAPEPQAQSL